MSIITFVIFLVALIPLLGWINWLNIPFAFIVLIVSIIALATEKDNKGQATAALILSLIAVLGGALRLILGLGIF